MVENKQIVTSKQLDLLLDELEANPGMSREKVLRTTRNSYDDKWNTLAEKLNAVPDGTKKDIPQWKAILSNLKTSIKKLSSADGGTGKYKLDEMSQRVLRLVEVEDIIQGLDMGADTENGGGYIFRRPMLRRTGRRKARVSMESAVRDNVLSQRNQSSLRTIFGGNMDHDGEPENLIVEQQLDRLYLVSRELENQIQNVQNRIQKIKDMWQHDCRDE